MSESEQAEKLAAIQRLNAEINRLREQQSAAQDMAGLRGMTEDESREYRERQNQIERLSKEAQVLNRGTRR